MSLSEYEIGSTVSVTVPQEFVKFILGQSEKKSEESLFDVVEDLIDTVNKNAGQQLSGEVSDVITIGDGWTLLFFEADNKEFYLEELEEDDESTYYLGVNWAFEGDVDLFDDEDEYIESLEINGEAFELDDSDEELDYYSADDEEEGTVEFVEYAHETHDWIFRAFYWDDEEELDSYMCVEISEADFKVTEA